MENIMEKILGSKSNSAVVTLGEMGDLGSILDWEDPLEKGLATHTSILAWSIQWTA